MNQMISQMVLFPYISLSTAKQPPNLVMPVVPHAVSKGKQSVTTLYWEAIMMRVPLLSEPGWALHLPSKDLTVAPHKAELSANESFDLKALICWWWREKQEESRNKLEYCTKRDRREEAFFWMINTFVFSLREVLCAPPIKSNSEQLKSRPAWYQPLPSSAESQLADCGFRTPCPDQATDSLLTSLSLFPYLYILAQLN